jgi:hypothetical protein
VPGFHIRPYGLGSGNSVFLFHSVILFDTVIPNRVSGEEPAFRRQFQRCKLTAGSSPALAGSE